MKPYALLIFFLCAGGWASAQKIVSRKQFFEDTALLHATLTTNYKTLINQKKEPVYQPADITFFNLDSSGTVKVPIKVKLRGNFRRANCSFASMTFDFGDKSDTSKLKNLKELKVVVPCEWGTDDEQWVVREYLVYRLFQLFTEKSFRARIVRFNFDDNSDSIKSYKQYGFILEDVDDLAKRNESKEVGDEEKIGSEETNRMHTTMVAIFQYMISNSDWKVPVRHNVKMIRPKDSATAKPYIIPYDFDYCGAVNALYAEPAPYLGIQKVTDRLYLGFPRTLDEINSAIRIFLEKENEVISTIRDYPLLRKKGKEEMLAFIEGFFTLIKDQANVKKIFVDNAITKWP
ncbi:MAG: hypothetical protein MUE99_00495 [Chitinophagaceae bacterium]|nr:hypothetical protein [Chitinophagaceae bacterium]